MTILGVDFPQLFRRAWRFGVVGVGVTALHSAIALALLQFTQVGPVWANVTAFVTSTLVSYTFNSLWSFESRMRMGSFARFATVSLAGLGLTVAIASLAKAYGFSPQLGVLFIALALPVFSFCVHNIWTFALRPASPGGDVGTGAPR